MNMRINGLVVLLGSFALAVSAVHACGKEGSCADPARATTNATTKSAITTPTGSTGARGGVRVALGDVNGDGASANGAQRPGVILTPAQKPQTLLLPAVQKVREAASR